MFKIHLGDTPHSLSAEDFKELGERTPGFSGSDINVVVKDVLMEPIRTLKDATHFKTVIVSNAWRRCLVYELVSHGFLPALRWMGRAGSCRARRATQIPARRRRRCSVWPRRA